MDRRDPIQQLMDEHRVIEKVLAALEAAAQQELPFTFYERAVDFIVNFADGCHHAKEEDRLFPALERMGMPREQGPIGVMCSEHEESRGLVREMRGAIERQDRETLRRMSLEYVTLLRQHIMKEDQVLFPMGRAQLGPDDLIRLRARFDEVSDGGGTERKYTDLANVLCEQAGI